MDWRYVGPLALVWAYMAAVALAELVWPHPARGLTIIGPSAFIAWFAVLPIAVAGEAWRTLRSGRSIRDVRMGRDFAARFALACSLLWPLPDVASWAKVRIPDVVAFWADPALARLEESLHGGWPWEWTVRAFPDPAALAWFYGPPFFTAVLGFILWFALFSRDSRCAARALASLVLIWAGLGNVLATLLSSVGPCYYGHLYSPDPFAPLMATLAGSPVAQTQAGLWAGTMGAPDPVGISAMPSVHIALAALPVFAFRHPALRALAIAFLAASLIASVRLGWHYAIDGYASILLVALIWWATGRVVRRLDRRDDARTREREHARAAVVDRWATLDA